MGELRIQQSHDDGGGAWFIEEGGRRVGALTYTVDAPGTVTFVHTEVGPELRGRGAGQKLVEAGDAWARAHGKKVIADCAFARSVLDKRPDLQDVLG